ncbi:cupin [Brachybacterium huguangmaarense]|uniref:Cupin n=1 Tax=Brachybacterium huguangmaarense TaxID=1652028 RepID=A0ABY6G2U0_9MICO|nr:cupin [Brachybacterium huguangmaarense]UYG17526.1 cupin [Brachybacterium huguangmaarense]
MPTLPEIAEQTLAAALAAENGRHAELMIHDGPLRQTVLALRAGTRLADHNAPPAASLQVLSGTVRVTSHEDVEASAGELLVLTHERHGVEALTDAAFLLTTVTSVPGIESHGE